MNSRLALLTGSMLCMLAVFLGAFGAHGLQHLLTERMLDTFHTGVDYQFMHAIGLLLIGLMIDRKPDTPMLRFAAALMLAGIVLFSFSLYLYVLTDNKLFAMITPAGGLTLALSWITLATGIARDWSAS